jgi:predicted transposase/invertase (TIGR01784 family)
MAEIDNSHDRFFKEIFGQPDIAADFVANYLPSEVVAELDLSALELVKDSFVDASLQEHFSDLLYRIKLRKAKTEAFIFFLFEHKSAPDKWTALQILRYQLEFWEREKRAGAKKLAPIFPIVFYHGKSQWKIPLNFSSLVDFHEQEYLKPFVPEYKYFLCDLSVLAEPQIIGSAFLKTTLLLMKNIRQKDLQGNLKRFWGVLKNSSGERLTDFLLSCTRYISASNDFVSADETVATIKKEFPLNEGAVMAALAKDWIQQGIKQGIEQGIEQGIQKGRLEEATKTALRQLHRRVGILPATRQEQVRKLSLEQLEQLSEDLLDFTSAIDLNNWLASITK